MDSFCFVVFDANLASLKPNFFFLVHPWYLTLPSIQLVQQYFVAFNVVYKYIF